MRMPPAMRAVGLGGLAAGVLDLAWALGNSFVQGKSQLRVLQSIASGILGKPAYDGGAATAALGVLLHFVIATGACLVFYLLSRWLPMLTRRPWLWGPLYGVGVYLVMYRVIVPLSAAPFRFPFAIRGIVLALIAHTLLVGLPIALAVSRFAPAARKRGEAPSPA